jgi:hypothetical protein
MSSVQSPWTGSWWRWCARDNRAVLLVLVGLVVFDLMAIALHIYATVRQLDNFIYYIHLDHSYGEFYQYAKYVWIFLLIAFHAFENRSWRVAMWLPATAFFFVDDTLEVHERSGAWVREAFGLGPAFGLRAQDVGELAFLGAAGLLITVPLVLGWIGADRRTRAIYLGFAALVGVLAFFGIVVDGVHMAFLEYPLVRSVLSVLEDGGEMVAVTLMVVFALRLNLSGGRQGFPDPVLPEDSLRPAEPGADAREAVAQRR